MQLFPHKIDTTLVRSFVSRTTRFNSCVYFYCYYPPVVPQMARSPRPALYGSTIFKIDIPRDIPTGIDPREPPIDQASDLPIELPIF